MKQNPQYIDIEIDKLTNSIENVITGDSFQTDVSLIDKSDLSGNLVAFVCRISFHRGFDGYVSFISKTQLIEHYEKTLGAKNVGGHLMVINTDSALKLIDKYFKN